MYKFMTTALNKLRVSRHQYKIKEESTTFQLKNKIS